MSYLDKCITECNKVLEFHNDVLAKELVETLVSEWLEYIPSIKKGLDRSKSRVVSIETPIRYDNVGDLKKIRGKLMAYKESQPIKNQLDAFIEQCDLLINDYYLDDVAIERLIDQVVRTYTSEAPEMSNGLGGYGYQEKNPEADILTLRSKLVAFRDKRNHEKEMALLKKSGINLTNTNINTNETTVSIYISLESTIELINSIPDDKLSEEDKGVLAGMLGQVGAAAKRDKVEIEKPLHKVLRWLSDKGVDVIIAVFPYILGLLQNL